jgi:hypothetical protein
MDINKRLYTFGCSFTKYKWPTWADFIGNQFEIYENWGQPGAGNLFISTQVYECCQKNCVGVDDTVLVMLSSTNRFDVINRNSIFLTEGNIYNSPSLPKEFVENIWSEEFGIYLTWFAANSIKRLLDGIGCKYKIMTAFDLTKLDDDSLMTEDLAVKGRVIHTLHDLRTEFKFNDNLNDFSKTMLKEGHSYYDFIEYGGNDDHPSMSIHLEWVKTYLPEFYDDKMLNLLKEWEHYIRPSVTATEKNFNLILNKNTTKFT